jgi:hypothetical protein
MFSLTRSNLLRQLPDLNKIIRRLTVNRDRYSFNRNIFLATAIALQQMQDDLHPDLGKITLVSRQYLAYKG